MTGVHAQESNVTVYGLIDLGFAKTSGQTTIERENHASRLGFRGTEKLGNNLSVVFQIETQFLADTGAQQGGLFDRQANVGLKGDFGTVYLGRTKDLLDGATSRIDPFIADGVVGKVNEAVFRGRVAGSRISNAVTYNSPSISGFVINGQLIASEVSGGKTGVNLLGTYDQGPFSAHAGYQRAVVTKADTAQPTLYILGAGYQIGDIKLTAGYSRGDTKVATTGRFTGWLLGMNYKLGKGDLKSVISRQTQTNNKLDDVAVIKGYGIGYDYHLSKRTDLYAYLGREQVAGLTSYQFGISHKF